MVAGSSRPARPHASINRSRILESSECGCFNCLALFLPDEVTKWVDGGFTAVCPHCGIDTVIGSASGLMPTRQLLSELREQYL